jgi:hypothetical protein
MQSALDREKHTRIFMATELAYLEDTYGERNEC